MEKEQLDTCTFPLTVGIHSIKIFTSQPSSQNHSSMTKVVAIPYIAFDSKWSKCYLDSGLQIILHPDIDNMTRKENYEGNDLIHVGDRTGLDIHQIGSSSFQSDYNSKVISLKQLFHVPSIT